MIVTIHNSISQVSGLSIDNLRELRELLSYTVETYSGGHRGKKYRSTRRHLMEKNGVFPTGLLSRVLGFLSTKQIVFRIDDLREVPVSNKNMFKLRLS